MKGQGKENMRELGFSAIMDWQIECRRQTRQPQLAFPDCAILSFSTDSQWLTGVA
jgi:hypothetical protein